MGGRGGIEGGEKREGKVGKVECERRVKGKDNQEGVGGGVERRKKWNV